LKKIQFKILTHKIIKLLEKHCLKEERFIGYVPTTVTGIVHAAAHAQSSVLLDLSPNAPVMSMLALQVT